MDEEKGLKCWKKGKKGPEYIEKEEIVSPCFLFVLSLLKVHLHFTLPLPILCWVVLASHSCQL